MVVVGTMEPLEMAKRFQMKNKKNKNDARNRSIARSLTPYHTTSTGANSGDLDGRKKHRIGNISVVNESWIQP